jgi:hypothetical protein
MRPFTRSNVAEVLRQWPQAVSMDEGDLRVLHDMANAGAQLWRERLPWPDYLWLDLNCEIPVTTRAANSQSPSLPDPTGRGPHASFPATECSVCEPELPPSGSFQISERITGIIELKVIDTDLMSKLSDFEPQLPWPEFVRLKFKWFGKRLRDADKQLAGGKRLLPLPDARGIVMFVNECSPNLPVDSVMAYFAEAIKNLANVDCIVYLSGRDDSRAVPQLAVKGNDAQLSRFAAQLLMMFQAFDYSQATPVSRCGVQPQLLARIEMDARSRAIYRSWAAGWRQADDLSPVPSVSMSISFVPREQFVSGLPKTEPDKSLLDCKFAWDFDPETMTIRNLRITR